MMSHFDSKLRGGLSGLMVICLCLTAGSGCGKAKAKVGSNRFTALGEVMAEKTTQLGDGKGALVLVVAEKDNHQSTDYGLAADTFRKALGKGMQVVATEAVKTPPVLTRGVEPLTAEKFFELLQKYSSADYLVSFVGVPPLTSAQIAQLPSPRPQVIEVITYNAPTKALFAGKVLSLAAVFKPESQEAALGGSAQEIFDAQYQLVTPVTVSLLAR
jgi:hypothetical protein